MSGLSLNLDQLKVMTRSLDVNSNHRIDESELGFQSFRALREASRDASGYANDVVGTTELAKALMQDRVVLKNLPVAVADRIANALSGGDAWISKEDLDLSGTLRARIDSNGDNRISRQEFSNALQDGTIEIGSAIRLSSHRPPSAIPGSTRQPSSPPPSTNVFDRLARVERDYNNGRLGLSEFSRIKKEIIAEEVAFLVADNTVPALDRLAQLDKINQRYSFELGLSNHRKAKETIIANEVKALIADKGAPALDRLQRLEALNTKHSFELGYSQFNQAKKTIIADEIQYLLSDRTTPASQRVRQLDRLYDKYSFEMGYSTYQQTRSKLQSY